MDKMDTTELGVKIQGEKVIDLMFADDIDAMSESSTGFQNVTSQMNSYGNNVPIRMLDA